MTEVTALDGDVDKLARAGTALDDAGLLFEAADGNGWAVQQTSSRVVGARPQLLPGPGRRRASAPVLHPPREPPVPPPGRLVR